MWTDFHSHILPKIDDGAHDVETSDQLLRMLHKQQVRTVAATPHFFLHHESVQKFIERRRKSYELLMQHNGAAEWPNIVLGAEVHLERGLSEQDLHPLCIGGSNLLLIEFPSRPFEPWMKEEIENIAYGQSIVPVLAHIERYIDRFDHDAWNSILSLPKTVYQFSVSLLHKKKVRAFANQLRQLGKPIILGSDAHNREKRPPKFNVARSALRGRGNRLLRDYLQFTNQALGAVDAAICLPNYTASQTRKKKRRIFMKILVSFAAVCVVLMVTAVGLFAYFFGGLKTEPLSADADQLAVVEQPQSTIRNIALFGVDSRNGDDSGRSDSMMVLSVDTDKHTLKLTSILRDSYVPIEGHGNTKINHAYSYGGPELAIKTINQNYKLDIQDYVTVNFDQMAAVIDYFGGVDISLSDAELHSLSGSFPNQLPNEAGLAHLNGDQAVGYSRIRYIDSDDARANRQRTVLGALFAKVQNMPATQYPDAIRNLLPMVKTSLDYADIVSLSSIFTNGKPTVYQYVVPNQLDAPQGGTIDGVWYWTYDLAASADHLHQFIYSE